MRFSRDVQEKSLNNLIARNTLFDIAIKSDNNKIDIARVRPGTFSKQNKAKYEQKFIIALLFEKNANFFRRKSQKSQKILIITWTLEFFVSFFQSEAEMGVVGNLRTKKWLSKWPRQCCQIFLDTIYQNGVKYTKLSQHFQMIIKYTKMIIKYTR
jgi:hypothetical protein